MGNSTPYFIVYTLFSMGSVLWNYLRQSHDIFTTAQPIIKPEFFQTTMLCKMQLWIGLFSVFE